MRQTTAEKVVILLKDVACLIEEGRPRKLPGKARPEGTYNGSPVKVTKITYNYVELLSLPGAFKLGRIAYGFTRHVQKLAEAKLLDAYAECWWPYATVEDLDNQQTDTRELARAARRAARLIEIEHHL